MTTSFFFLQAEKNTRNQNFINELEIFCNHNKRQVYLINKPLGDSKYSYTYEGAIVLLMPKHKISFIDFSNGGKDFDAFVEDFVEDLGSISDKYRYKDFIGRPRSWSDLIQKTNYDSNESVEGYINNAEIQDARLQRKCELLISLLTGSINDIDTVQVEIPETLLDKVKRKILLFDGDQTRFVYDKRVTESVTIQGLSGTGKTELLLHKLKELYVENANTKIVFTCHNKILADNLIRRIPDFFNFMKVEQQIKWADRLWCMHAWGSGGDPNSGTYRKICHHYNIPFEAWSRTTTFNEICLRAIQVIDNVEALEKPFDYMLIDESQDFPESFFNLCKKVTKFTVYIAGDIFQSIFDATATDEITPDYLLSKCYRTDPRTLMFAHALGMGLFEPRKLRWLEDNEWRACGYSVEKFGHPEMYRLRREPLRRFEDIDRNDIKSVELIKVPGPFESASIDAVISAIEKIRSKHSTVVADDIGIIIMDSNNAAYAIADKLSQAIQRVIGWSVNKAYESKRKIAGTVFISNRNNVKGLEFPFVICITGLVTNKYGYRNALYMTLTRSFLQTFLIIAESANHDILSSIKTGLDMINQNDYIELQAPSNEEKIAIRTTITHSDNAISFFDFITKILDESDVPNSLREALISSVVTVLGEDFDREKVKEMVEFIYKRMRKGDA